MAFTCILGLEVYSDKIYYSGPNLKSHEMTTEPSYWIPVLHKYCIDVRSLFSRLPLSGKTCS